MNYDHQFDDHAQRYRTHRCMLIRLTHTGTRC